LKVRHTGYRFAALYAAELAGILPLRVRMTNMTQVG